MDPAQRIAQFENMAGADPDNEMAHFSLGKAYAEAGRFGDAAASYLRCAEIVPAMSKAYQLAGEMLVKAGERDKAAEVLTRGYTIAAERGDLMPRNAIADALKTLGRPVPAVADAPGRLVNLVGGPAAPAKAGDAAAPHLPPHLPPGGFLCARTGRPGTKMDRPPFKGPVGEWIAANIARETFTAWIAQGTKVINELRLDLSRDQDEETYDQHMREYLGIDEELHASLTAKR